MTTEGADTHLREWLLAAVVLLGLAGDIATRYWGASADSHVTAGQVATLTSKVQDLSGALKELSDKLGNMPRPSDMASLSSRVDREEQSTGEIQQRMAALRSDVDNLMRTPPFRNPKN